MSKVKLFDLNRLARFENTYSGEPVYFVPGDIVALIERDNSQGQYGGPNYPSQVRVHLTGDLSLDLCATLPEVEAEINRALAATSTAAHEYADESAKEIADKLIQLKATIHEADMHSMNDFTPDLNKDKKGYN